MNLIKTELDLLKKKKVRDDNDDNCNTNIFF